jgi:hypothetical protein
MKKWLGLLFSIFFVAFMVSCGGGSKLPEELKLSFAAAKGYKGPAKGTVTINTKTGTDVTFNITGLEAGEVYTAFFVNVKSMMFEGIGQTPFTLPVDASGNLTFAAKTKKDVYKRFTELGVFLNPGKKPLGNPLGVKATLGAIIKQKTAKMVLFAKLR